MNGMQVPFQSSLFALAELAHIRCIVDNSPLKRFMLEYTLITVAGGRGTGTIDGKSCRLVKGGCWLALPGALVDAEGLGAEGVELYFVSFRMEKIARGQEQGGEAARQTAVTEGFPLHGKLNVQPFGQWRGMLDELYRHRAQRTGLEGYRQHIRLQELLYYACERNDGRAMQDSRAAVGATIDGLHENPARSVSVKQLAELAQMGVRQYAYVFKELTGRSPMDYMTELRINEAKKQLLVSSEPLNTIARNAGFQDVYYFSRRFKQVVGMSPRQFTAKRRSELRVVALYYAGILMSIGVKPVGANLTWWGGSDFLKEQESGIIDVGALPSLEQIAELQPDLILMNDTHAQYYSQFSKIAPSVVIPYDGKRNVYEDIRLVGNLVDNGGAAERFIARYERMAAASQIKLAAAGIVRDRAKAAIIRIDEGGTMFSVFGDNYGRSGWAIYRGLGLAAPDRVRSLIESGEQIAQRMPIALLTDYAADADYVFVINEGDGVDSVADHDVWRRLEAVNRNGVFELNKERFSYFDPISLEAQLGLLTEMLLERGA